MITREQIAQLLKSISEAHYQIHSYGWGDVPDLLAREDVIYPFLMVTPSSSNYEEGYVTHTYTISIADRVLKDKANEVNVDSDTHQILLDILSQIDNLMYDDVDVVKGGTITPFFDNFRHEVTGHFADVGIRVKFAYDSCAVPSDIVPLPLPPPFECADASYRVQYVNGTLIEQGTIVSGGSKTINVPNPSICDDASYQVLDDDGNVLYSGTIASGGSENIVVTNSTVVVRKSDNTIISSVSVLAQGSANYQVADSVITLTDTSAATLSTTNVKATDPATIVAPNGTLNVNKSDGVLISGQVVKSGETKGYNVADSVVSNSNASYTANVKATDPLTLPDQQINVNSVDEGDIPSVGTIDINLTDGVNPVAPTSVNITGRTVAIEVSAGIPDVDVTDTDVRGQLLLPTKPSERPTNYSMRALDWADDFISNLTAYTLAKENAIIDLVTSLDAAGLWSKMDYFYPIIGDNAADNSLSLKYPRIALGGNAIFSGSPTHGAGFIQNSGSSVMYFPISYHTFSQTDFSMGFYSLDTAFDTTNANPMGFGNAFGNFCALYIGTAGALGGNPYFANQTYGTRLTFSTSGIDAKGLFVGDVSASLRKVSRNGSTLASSAGTLGVYNGVGQPPTGLFYNGVGTGTRRFSLFFFGKSMGATQTTDFNTIIQQFMTDKGL